MKEDRESTNSSRPSRKEMRESRRHAKRRRRRRPASVIGGILGGILCLALIAIAIGFFTPWGRNLRLTLAETVITTRHYQWARYITTGQEYQDLLKALKQDSIGTGIPNIHVQLPSGNENVIEVKPIDGLPDYNGYIMLVHDPHLVRLVAAHVRGSEGEYITDMAKRVGAIGGTNASGFADPSGAGWGGIPVGIEMVNGQELGYGAGAYGWTSVGFTTDGLMVMGPYSASRLRDLGVRDAMQFHPELVVNGRPMITYGDGGWGYGPRTAIGQTRDGTVILIVANGRFKGGAGAGASQRQMMDLMLKYGAVNACAMDGGSSSVFYYDGQILNHPSTVDPNGQRHLPDAWMVFPSRTTADAYAP